MNKRFSLLTALLALGSRRGGLSGRAQLASRLLYAFLARRERRQLGHEASRRLGAVAIGPVTIPGSTGQTVRDGNQVKVTTNRSDPREALLVFWAPRKGPASCSSKSVPQWRTPGQRRPLTAWRRRRADAG